VDSYSGNWMKVQAVIKTKLLFSPFSREKKIATHPGKKQLKLTLTGVVHMR
jgi:hypothetical protein